MNQEYKWQGTTAQKKRRAQRNAARRKAIREGRAKKGDGKDVHHTDGNKKGKLNNRRTKVISRSANRSAGGKARWRGKRRRRR